MENQPIGPFLDEQWHELRRLAHHQVDFQRQPRDWTKTVYHHGSHAKVRNEMAVHDVDMDELSSRPLNDLDLVCQMAEIGCQNGWGNVNHDASPPFWAHVRVDNVPVVIRISDGQTGNCT